MGNHINLIGISKTKDMLFRSLRTMKGIYGQIYEFFPLTFSVPSDFIRFARIVNKEQEDNNRVTIHLPPIS